MFEHVVTSSRGGDEKPKQIISVSELNHLVAMQLRSAHLTGLYVRGQVSGFSVNSGHWYFELKDSNEVVIRCAAWRSSNVRMKAPKNGDQVIVHGTVNYYEPRGSVSFVVDSMQADGQSDLYLRFLQLKEQLKAEGLFDLERKRPLPRRPRKIAMVTSQQGAVIHDVCRVARNRDPGVSIVLLPVPVQGAAAAPGIVRGIQVAGTIPDVDVIIVGRGGGSMEDLWCFNDERVVRAIAASPVPVISGIGHDTDTTLSDFAADVRAATPSQAAEFAVPDLSGIRTMITALKERMHRVVAGRLDQTNLRLVRNQSRMEKASPFARIERLEHAAGLLKVRLASAADMTLNTRQFDIEAARAKLTDASHRIPEEAQERIDQLSRRMVLCSPEKQIIALERVMADRKVSMHNSITQHIHRMDTGIRELQAKMHAMNPSGVLERGYAFVTSGSHIVQSAVSAPESMTLHFHDGLVHVQRTETEVEKNGKNDDI